MSNTLITYMVNVNMTNTNTKFGFEVLSPKPNLRGSFFLLRLNDRVARFDVSFKSFIPTQSI